MYPDLLCSPLPYTTKGNSLVFGGCYNYLSILRNPRTDNLPSQTCCQREMHGVTAGSSFLVALGATGSSAPRLARRDVTGCHSIQGTA